MFEGKSSAVSRYTRAVLVLFAVLLSGCQPTTTATPTPLPPPVTLVVNPAITDVLAGDTRALTVETSGQDLRFKWSAARGKLSAFDTPAVFYTAPDTKGVDTVTVEVSSASGTTVEHVSFNIVLPTPTVPPTPVPSPTPAPSPTITITAPLTEVVCPLNDACRFDVEGTSSGVVSDPDLEVIIYVRDADQWWPHKTVVIESDGAWRGSAQIGDRPCWSAGHQFEIVAVAVTGDQADLLPQDFQPLPRNYVARSHSVGLVTTYAPVQIDLSLAESSYDARGIDIVTPTLVNQSQLSFDYNLRSEGGWVQFTIPMHLDMSCMKEVGFSIAFSLEGAGAVNSLEVKLEDTGSTSYGWRRPRGSVTAGPQMIEVPLDHLEFWWDADGQDIDMNWQEVMNILFAISQHPGDDGGEGQVTISDVVLIPPAIP